MPSSIKSPKPTPSIPSTEKMKKLVINRLKKIYDPELPVSIYDLGLIYEIIWSAEASRIDLLMTLTSPNCPVAETLPLQVKEAILEIPQVKEAIVELTFNPPYSTDRLSQEAKILLDWPIS